MLLQEKLNVNMKKNLLLFTFLFSALISNAQITKTVIPQKTEPARVEPFDSTKNWHGNKNIMAFKGQQLYFFDGKARSSYNDIHTKKGDIHPNFSKEIVLGHTFVIIDIESYPDEILYDYILTLEDVDSHELLYFNYDSKREPIFPDYIFVSHFNYLKTKYVGREYVVLPKAISLLKTQGSDERVYNKDINTGEEIKYNPLNNCYKIIDVSIKEDEINPIIYIINNGEHTTYFEDHIFSMIENQICERIVEKKEWESLKSKYGQVMMNHVINGTIKVGMPKRLLILSWGYPDKINRSSYGDTQYVYGSQYVYIDKNDIISAWN